MPSDTHQEEMQGDSSKVKDVSDESSSHRKRTRDGEEHFEVSSSTTSPDINAKKPRAGTREDDRSEESTDTKGVKEPKDASKNSVPTAMPNTMPTTCCAESTTSVPVVVPTPALANMQQPAVPFVLKDDHQQDSALAAEQKDISPLPTNLVTPDAVASITSDTTSVSRDQVSPPAVPTEPSSHGSIAKITEDQEGITRIPVIEAEQSKDTKQSTDLGQSKDAEQSKDVTQSVTQLSASKSNDQAPTAAASDPHGKQDSKGEQDTSALNKTSTTKSTESTKPVPNKSGPSLGFGAFAARGTPFQTASANAKESSPQTPSGSSNWAHTEGEPGTADADDIVVRKKSVRKPDADLPTGEEEEQTMVSVRAKLFAMSSDHSWKERGTGLLKINTRASQGTTRPAARLVMRSDAVLKVILNVQIFTGMQCHIEQERFLRFVAMEEEGLVHFAVKFANASDAHTFMEQLQDHIPASSSKDSS